MVRNEVAQTVDSVRTVRIVSAYDSGQEWAAFVGPTRAGQRASRARTLRSVLQPFVSTSFSNASPSVVGSRSSGRAPDRTGSTGVGRW